MADPNEFKILLATDIHLGYQHKHEVGLLLPSFNLICLMEKRAVDHLGPIH